MCSPASAIFASFEAISMYFNGCGRSLLWNWLLKLILTENLFKIASKLTSIVTILANIALAGDHIFQVLAQYSWVLPQYLQVLSQYLRVLSRWIHPWTFSQFYFFFHFFFSGSVLRIVAIPTVLRFFATYWTRKMRASFYRVLRWPTLGAQIKLAVSHVKRRTDNQLF